MADLSARILPLLQQNRLPGLSLPEELLAPHYAGYSILNLPHSVCRWLDVPEPDAPERGAPGSGALAPELLEQLGGPFQRVILVLLDALSFQRLQRWMRQTPGSVWEQLAERGLLVPLTSVVPSTTSAALTSLWTGRSPREHGIAGYELWLKEYGLVANTILLKPMSFAGPAGSLEQAGFNPEEALPGVTLGAHLAAQGVTTYALQHASIARSALSRMLLKDATAHSFFTASDLWVNVRRLIQSKPDQRMYVYVYWSEIDTLGHVYGAEDERPEAEWAAFGAAMQRLFLDRLDPALRQGTLLLITGDHGQTNTQPDAYYDLRNHPALLRRLHLQPTGEHRLTYLHVRPGQTEAVREYIQRTWPNQFSLLDSAYAVESGLFGPGPSHPGLLDRVGDLIAAARGPAYFWWEAKENKLFGRHGGLSPEEMLVPLLACPLAQTP